MNIYLQQIIFINFCTLLYVVVNQLIISNWLHLINKFFKKHYLNYEHRLAVN